MYRKWSVLVILLLAAMALAACGGGAAPAEEEMAEEEMAEEEAAPAEEEMAEEEMAEEEMAEEEMAAPEIDCMGSEGSSISVIGVWSGDEQASFEAIFAPLLEACDLTLEYEGTRDLAALLQTRVEGGNPPDISMMPNPGALLEYAANGDLIPVADVGANLDNYDQGWLDPLSYEGEVYGVFVKADIKSTIWYSPVAFDAAGYEVPETWDELVALADQMVADGNVPFSMGMFSDAATGWTATDTVQDILMRTAGVDMVGGLVDGSTAWNDPAVAEAWEAYGTWATDDSYALGGADGTVTTPFIDAINLVFADPPQAYMVRQSGFAGGVVAAEYPELEFGTDYDFFIVPSVDGSPPPVQVGGDAMAVFNDTPAVRAVVAYLTSAEGGKAWAASGFDLSPNGQVTGADYTSALSAKKADALANAPAVSFDVGDLLPAGLGQLEFDTVTAYVNGGDLTALLDEMEARAAEAHSS